MIKVDREEVQFKSFNDGTLRLRFVPYSLVGGCTITWLYDSDEEMADLYFLVNHLRDNYKISYLILEMWYVPHARMDRIKENDECFTLKHFCKFINSLNFNKVKIYDPHSNVTPALLERVEVYRPTLEINGLLDTYKNATLFFTDEGGTKRYKDIIGDNYFAFGVKDREWSTQDINSLQVMGAKHMIAGHDILLCDDIISRGSTIYLASTQLKELGANNIYVYVSHCENTVLRTTETAVGLLDIPDLITKMYTTNSIFRGEHPKIEVIHKF